MAKALIVHDDSVISRVAYLLEKRKEAISHCRAVLRGDPGLPPEYALVNKEQVKAELEAEQWALSDLLEDIEDWLFAMEIRQIFEEYVQDSNHAEKGG